MISMSLHLITTAVLLSCAFADCDLTGGPPKIEIYPRNQTVEAGAMAVIVCMVTDCSNPQIKWVRINGSESQDRLRFKSVYGEPNRIFKKLPIFQTINMTNGSVLRTYALGPETFDCVVEEGADEPIRATAHLKTIPRSSLPSGFPRITLEGNYNLVVTTGHSILLPFVVTGYPKPTMRCFRNKLPLNMSIPRYSLYDGQFLQISDAKEEDRGEYDCIATNSLGTALSTIVRLHVTGYSQHKGFPLVALETNYNVLVTKGYSTLLPFLVTGDPEPPIRWLKNRIPLNMSIPRYSVFEGQFLQISDAREEDAGEYECIDNNSLGRAISPRIRLHVIEILWPPYFIAKPAKLYGRPSGSSLNITCLANGSPQPSVKWVNDSTDISPHRYGLNVLVLTDIQGSHEYTCVASSGMGDKEVTTRVVALNLPIAPTRLRMSPRFQDPRRCIDLWWSYDNPEDIIDKYLIRYKKRGDNYFHETLIEHFQGRHYALCDLLPHTQYEFYVIANNIVGWGPRSYSFIIYMTGI